jgi:hypothetical protein
MQMVRCVEEYLPVRMGIEVLIVEYENSVMQINMICHQVNSQCDRQITFAV